MAEKEAAKAVKLAEKEAAKAAKLAEKEAAKAVKLAEKEAAKEAAKKNKVNNKTTKNTKKSEEECEVRVHDDKIMSLQKKVNEFQVENKRSPTADELNEMYPEVYI